MQTVVVANFRDQRIEYYDSMGSKPEAKVSEEVIAGVRRWVVDEYQQQYEQPATGQFDVCPYLLRCCQLGLLESTTPSTATSRMRNALHYRVWNFSCQWWGER